MPRKDGLFRMRLKEVFLRLVLLLVLVQDLVFLFFDILDVLHLNEFELNH